jgi:hypothetical protein
LATQQRPYGKQRFLLCPEKANSMNRTHIVAACFVSALAFHGGAALAESSAPLKWDWHLRPAVPRPNEHQRIAILTATRPETLSLVIRPPEHHLEPSDFEKTRTHSFGFEAGNIDATIETTRAKSLRVDGLSSFARPRYARIETRLGLETGISPKDMQALIGSIARERRQPAVLIEQHNHITDNDVSLSLGWNHDDHIQLSMGVFDIRSTRQNSRTDRLIAIASGEPRSASGVALSLNLAPTGNRDTFSLGFDLRRQNAESNQSSIEGGHVRETISALSAQLKF